MTNAELIAAIEQSTIAGHTKAVFRYVNVEGKEADREAFLSDLRLWFGRTTRHPELQWLVDALDPRGRPTRVFAIRRMSDWRSA